MWFNTSSTLVNLNLIPTLARILSIAPAVIPTLTELKNLAVTDKRDTPDITTVEDTASVISVVIVLTSPIEIELADEKGIAVVRGTVLSISIVDDEKNRVATLRIAELVTTILDDEISKA